MSTFDHIEASCFGSGKSLRIVCLEDLYNGQCFEPMIVGATNLRCSGDWDKVLLGMANRVGGVVEVHLEGVRVSDLGLSAISNCLGLEILHIVKVPGVTYFGLRRVAKKCRLLKKLHVDGGETNRISDDGLIVVASHCVKLEVLVLRGVNPTLLSLVKLAANCRNVETLALGRAKLLEK